MKVRGKGKAPMSDTKPENSDASNNAETETTGSETLKIDGEAPVIVSGGEEKKEEDTEEEVKQEENTEEEVKEGEKGEATPNKKANKSRKRNKKKKKGQNTADAEAVKDANKPETSDGKKDSKKAESMGMIFMCSSKTKKDCYNYKVLGLPASKKDVVAKIYKGMRLFLFDIDLKLMYGIYKAAGPGGYNIEPKAFKSAFPSQVRFTVLEDCLPLGEEKFKKVIKDNYYGKNKFNGQLTSEQVKNLCKLFRATAKGSMSKRVATTSRTEARTFGDRDRSRRRIHDGVRRPPLDRDLRFPKGPSMYEREAFSSPVLPPPLPVHRPYVHERPLDMDYYRRDTHLEHHDRRLLDLELRRREEIEYRDPYAIYREPPPIRDPLYHAAALPVYPPPTLYRY